MAEKIYPMEDCRPHAIPRAVVFTATQVSGPGHRVIGVAVPVDQLLRLAEAIRKCGPEETLGHAFWHYENPGRPLPCSTCVCRRKEASDV